MAQSGRLDEYEVEIRDGITVTMRLSREHAERADPKRIRPVANKAWLAENKGRQPANKAD